MKLNISLKAFLPLGLVVLMCNSGAMAQNKGFSKDQSETIAILNKKGYFKSASCVEVAGTFLEKNGLPGIGKNSPIEGKRGNFDRSKSNQDLPVFKDELIATNGQRLKMNAFTSNEAGKQIWNLKIERISNNSAKSPATLSTNLVFEMGTDQSGSSCELSSLNFQGTQVADTKPENLTIQDCLDFFLRDVKLAKVHTQSPPILEWIKKDCAVSLHYSKEVKSKLTN